MNSVGVWICLACVALHLPRARSQRLFFSKYLSGSGTGTQELAAVEIHNPSCMTVNMTEFAVVVARDGKRFNIGSRVTLFGTLEPGSSYTVATRNFEVYYSHSVDLSLYPGLIKRDFTRRVRILTGTLNWFDGNDAIGLLHFGVLIDQIGRELDPSMAVSGSSFTIAGNTQATRESYMYRKSWVTEGNLGKWREKNSRNTNRSEWVVESLLTSTDSRLSDWGIHSVDGLRYPCSAYKLTCATRGTTLLISYVEGQSMHVECPANCHLTTGVVLGGNGKYWHSTPICKAAIQSNLTGLQDFQGIPIGQGYIPTTISPDTTRYGEYQVNLTQYSSEYDILAPKADIVVLGPRGMSQDMRNHLKRLANTMLFYGNDQLARMMALSYSTGGQGVQPSSGARYRNNVDDFLTDVNTVFDFDTTAASSGIDLGVAIKEACDRVTTYDINDISTYESPRLDAQKILIVYNWLNANAKNMQFIRTYAPCFQDHGWKILMISSTSATYGDGTENALTSYDLRYSWINNVNLEEGLFAWMLEKLWEGQECWDRLTRAGARREGRMHGINVLSGDQSNVCVNGYQMQWDTDYLVTDAVTNFLYTIEKDDTFQDNCLDLGLGNEDKNGNITCAGHGVCRYDQGYCECNDGYYGDDCAKRECAPCYNAGTCNSMTGLCDCVGNYHGDQCLQVHCLTSNGQCDGKGTCNFETDTIARINYAAQIFTMNVIITEDVIEPTASVSVGTDITGTTVSISRVRMTVLISARVTPLRVTAPVKAMSTPILRVDPADLAFVPTIAQAMARAIFSPGHAHVTLGGHSATVQGS
ncbi:hypothetical protein AAMO2058_000174000 [Amorphochlora amoebiformis]